MSNKKEEPNYALRMYCVVAYNLSPIQKGIQAAHALARYAYNFGHTELFKRWVSEHETLILLDGGTSNWDYLVTKSENGETFKGSLNNLWLEFQSRPNLFGENLNFFNEPDYNNGMTAFCLIVDERVWERKIYPDYRDFVKEYSEDYVADNGAYVRQEWLNLIGGEQIAFMKEKLNHLPLAR